MRGFTINNELERTSKEERKPKECGDNATETVRGLNPDQGKYFTFKNVQTGSAALPDSYLVSTRVIPGGLGGLAVTLNTQLQIAPRLGVELYIYSPYTPLWREHGHVYLRGTQRSWPDLRQYSGIFWKKLPYTTITGALVAIRNTHIHNINKR